DPVERILLRPEPARHLCALCLLQTANGDRGRSEASQSPFQPRLNVMSEPWHWNAPQLSAAFGRLAISPVEVATSLLARIRKLDSEVNSFCLIDEGATLEQAHASEERWLTGAALSPLAGVPVAVTDLLLTRG